MISLQMLCIIDESVCIFMGKSEHVLNNCSMILLITEAAVPLALVWKDFDF